MKPLFTSLFAFGLLLGTSARALPQEFGPSEPMLPGQSALSIPQSTVGTSPSAPSSENPFLGGIPSGQATEETLSLSLEEAINRGLTYNLGLLLSDERTRAARGARWRALSELLPQINAHASGTREQINLAALGFSGFPNIPQVIGPFSVVDARLYLSLQLLNLKSLYGERAESDNLRAAQFSYRDAQDVVVLVCASLYLQAVAGVSRVEAAISQVKTAEALYRRAVDLKGAGVVPSIDVVRSQVEFQAQQQRLIFFENEVEKEKLSLARAIGLPIGQPFSLADRLPYNPAPPMAFEEAVQQAYRERADLQGALAQVEAAEALRKSAFGEALPSLEFDGDYGSIGNNPGDARQTFTAAVMLKIPLFQGGNVRGKLLEAEALLRQRRQELSDLRGRIDLEVRTALLDLRASDDQVKVAKSTLDLAEEELRQAQDRFSAGVVSSIEVVQAQNSVAAASENYISSLYGFNAAKASLGRAIGKAEQIAKQLLVGPK